MGPERIGRGEGPEAVERRVQVAPQLEVFVTSFSTGWKKFTCRRASR